MKEFPNSCNVNNKSEFTKLLYNRNLCYLRRDIYDLLLKEDETNYFDLSKFANNRDILDDDIKKMTKSVQDELEVRGWKTKTSFAGTGLFIYSTENPPSNCFPDDF